MDDLDTPTSPTDETPLPKLRRDRRESLKATVKPFKSKQHPQFAWVVYWPAIDPGKPRNYRRFRLKKEAESFAADKEIEIKNRGREAAALNDRISKEAAWAVRELKPYGVTLREVVGEYLARRRAAERSARVADAVGEFMELKKGAKKSTAYLSDLRYKLNRFANAPASIFAVEEEDDDGDGRTFGELLMSEVTTGMLDAWLASLGGAEVTRNGFRRVLSVFFTWGGKRGYCDREENAARATEKAEEKAARVPIFTPGEIRVILDNAPVELLPVVALGAFAGLRPEEIRRLDWKAVDFLRKRIDIDAGISKTAAHRYVPMNETLIAWLQPVAKAAGRVAPRNYYRRLWKYHLELADKEKAKDRPTVEWKHNALRHSFASYALAKEEDAARVALWLGHTSPVMTFKHYRERVTPEAADQWFAVMPREKKAKKTKLEAVA
jgi:integrase